MPELSLPLSTNFKLRELLHSDTAERDERLKAEQENPPEDIIENLQYLVQTALQPIRTKLGFPIQISSGYRSPLVNKLIGGSATSQHCRGEAADCKLSSTFLTNPDTTEVRAQIKAGVEKLTGKPLRPDVSENFYLFAFICMRLDELDVDQVIHEYGEDFGHPSWVHISCSRRQDKRQILCVGSYTNRRYISPTVEEALAYGV